MSGLDEGLTGAVVRGRMHGLTPLRIGVPVRPIITDFSTRFFAFGSCFAQNATEVLARLGWAAFFDRAVVTHYSSRTLRALLERWLQESPYREDELYRFAGSPSYCSPYHRALGARGPDAAARLLREMTVRDRAARTALRAADVVLLTLGNATHLARPGGGSFCGGGGVPASDYEVRGQSVAEIRDDLEHIHRSLARLCDKPFQLVVTVSPQRYGWRTGHGLGSAPGQRARDPIVSSDLDKAKLRVAVDEFERGHDLARVEYFPSYEIVMDELRLHETFQNDASDHLHVSYPATSNYVVNRFLLSHCSPALIETLQFQRSASQEIERQIKLVAAPRAQQRLVTLLGEARARHLALPTATFLRELVSTFARHDLLDLARAHLGDDLVAAVHDDPARRAVAILDRALARLDGWVDEWRERRARVLIYGAGRHTLMLLQQTRLLDARPIALADVAAEKMRPFFALPVIEPAAIAAAEPDVVLISCVGDQEAMRAEVGALGLPGVEVKGVYEPDELAWAKLALGQRASGRA